MKSILVTSLLFFWGLNLQAQSVKSSNVYDRLYLVVQNIDEEGQFFVERVPMVGCHVLTHTARLIQFTSAYLAPSDVGCGGEMTSTVDINALSCAKVLRSVEGPTLNTFTEIDLDISGCPERNNPNFISMLRTAAKYNFPQNDRKREVQLTILK